MSGEILSVSKSATNTSLLTPRAIAPPFAWQHKPAIWRIREAFDCTTYLDQALAVYLVLCELASDEQSETFTVSRRKIAERSGVSLRRVSDILERFKQINLLIWNQNRIEGSKELGHSTYTLMSSPACTTSGTDSTRLGTNGKSENCTVNEQSQKNLSKTYSTKGPSKLSKRERDLANDAELILKGQWRNDCGKWINRIKEIEVYEDGRPDKARPGWFSKTQRVFAEVKSAITENRIETTPAQFAEQCWKEFA